MNFGCYQILDELGKGSIGVVYKAHDHHFDRLVALKVIQPDRFTSEEFVSRFLNEMGLIGKLLHPNIVKVYDAGKNNGDLFIATEFIEGRSLRQLIQEKKISTQDIFTVAVQMAEALDYAHQKGIVHRNIKPSKLFLTPDGRVKITDFGIMWMEPTKSSNQTQVPEVLGAPFYMSPEMISGEFGDGRTDFYSLGAILYELTTGRPPFHSSNIATIFYDIVNVSPLKLYFDSGIPSEFSELIMKCL
jgi:serine/threonine protein kinase